MFSSSKLKSIDFYRCAIPLTFLLFPYILSLPLRILGSTLPLSHSLVWRVLQPKPYSKVETLSGKTQIPCSVFTLCHHNSFEHPEKNSTLH